jgi:hypothetical protein
MHTVSVGIPIEKPTTACSPSFSRSTSSALRSATCPRTLSAYVVCGKSLAWYGAGVFDGDEDYMRAQLCPWQSGAARTSDPPRRPTLTIKYDAGSSALPAPTSGFGPSFNCTTAQPALPFRNRKDADHLAKAGADEHDRPLLAVRVGARAVRLVRDDELRQRRPAVELELGRLEVLDRGICGGGHGGMSRWRPNGSSISQSAETRLRSRHRSSEHPSI